MLRAAHLALLCIAAGLLALRVLRPRTRMPASSGARAGVAALALAASLVAAFFLLIAHGAVLVPEASPFDAVAAACSTWIGQVIAVQALLAGAALACVLIGGTRRWSMGLALCLALMAASSSAFRGHVIAASEAGALGLVAVLHVTLAAAWVSGLAALTACRLLERSAGPALRWRDALQAFSRWALPGMLLLLVTGALLALRTVGSGAALVATPYGVTLLAKLALIAAALGCALQLRRWLARPATMASERAAHWLSVEAVLALLLLGLAGVLASTVPAAHDIIDWPWPFRIAPTAAWLQKGSSVYAPIAGAALLLGVSLLAGLWLRHRSRWRAAGVLVLGSAGSAALALPALSVDAYPTSYWHAPIGYDAASVTAGARLYQPWCAGCHGEHGHGDGPLAAGLARRPANLTEPHVQWHTHGDLYWWLTQGIAGTGMPGFRDRLSDDERWQMLNFLAALSLGHEARPLSARISPRDPWLPAIDFRYATDAGEFVSLSAWRRQQRSVLLAFIGGDAAPRERLPAALPGRFVPLAVLRADAAKRALPAGWQPVVDANGDIAAAWSHYRRTLDDPDFNNERSDTDGLLFLIDRFGFVRARWARGDAWPSAPQLAALVAQLEAEPELRSADIHASR